MVLSGILKQAKDFWPVAPSTAKSVSQINSSNLCIPSTRPKEHPCNTQVVPASDTFLLNDVEARTSLYQNVVPTVLWSSFCRNLNFRYKSWSSKWNKIIITRRKIIFNLLNRYWSFTGVCKRPWTSLIALWKSLSLFPLVIEWVKSHKSSMSVTQCSSLQD